MVFWLRSDAGGGKLSITSSHLYMSLLLCSMGPQMPWLWGLRQTRCPFQATMLHARRTVQQGPMLTQPWNPRLWH